jgi:hypothetical protein
VYPLPVSYSLNLGFYFESIREPQKKCLMDLQAKPRQDSRAYESVPIELLCILQNSVPVALS